MLIMATRENLFLLKSFTSPFFPKGPNIYDIQTWLVCQSTCETCVWIYLVQEVKISALVWVYKGAKYSQCVMSKSSSIILLGLNPVFSKAGRILSGVDLQVWYLPYKGNVDLEIFESKKDSSV